MLCVELENSGWNLYLIGAAPADPLNFCFCQMARCCAFNFDANHAPWGLLSKQRHYTTCNTTPLPFDFPHEIASSSMYWLWCWLSPFSRALSHNPMIKALINLLAQTPISTYLPLLSVEWKRWLQQFPPSYCPAIFWARCWLDNLALKAPKIVPGCALQIRPLYNYCLCTLRDCLPLVISCVLAHDSGRQTLAVVSSKSQASVQLCKSNRCQVSVCRTCIKTFGSQYVLACFVRSSAAFTNYTVDLLPSHQLYRCQQYAASSVKRARSEILGLNDSDELEWRQAGWAPGPAPDRGSQARHMPNYVLCVKCLSFT